jgi:GAF domain-containing protein
MHMVPSTGPTEPRFRSEDEFQQLLLEISEAASSGTSSPLLIQLFCKRARRFFGVDGAYFWRCVTPEELIGTEADGLMAADFCGRRLRAHQSAVAVEAIRQRKTVYVNEVDPGRYPMAAEFQARSLLAAPLVVANEVIGAAVFLHATQANFFTDDLAAKATILAGQLGSLVETNRLTQVSREEHRRTEILTEVAQAVHTVPNAVTVAEAVAAHLRVLLRTRLVCIVLREGAGVVLHAVAAESPQLAAAVRASFDHRALDFAADLAGRALTAGEPITIEIDPATHSLGGLVTAGLLLVVPLRTSRTHGAILVYPRTEGAFRIEEKSLVSAVAGFGAVAIANAELCATARAQSYELQQLLDISSELGSLGDLDQFMQHFALRAAEFLGFGRCFLGLLEDGAFRVHWGADGGRTQRVDLLLPQGPTTNALLEGKPFWFNDPNSIPGANLDVAENFRVKQMLTVPLLDTEGQVVGMFGVVDRVGGAIISEEDVRAARALAAQASVALVATRNLHQSVEHRRRAESLMGLVLELGTHLQLPDFAKSFVLRAADLMGSQAAALAVKQGLGFEVVAAHGMLTQKRAQPGALRRLERALSEVLAHHQDMVLCAGATQLFGTELSAILG